MLILAHDCPKCSVSNAAFQYVSDIKNPAVSGEHFIFFRCPKCFEPITVKWHDFLRVSIKEMIGDLNEVPSTRGVIKNIEPPARELECPPHTPPDIADIYLEALDSLYRQKWTSAASMLRKCLEVALKAFSPEIEAWKLEKRIDKLAAENLITPALKDWAHELRLDGNEALHGDQPANEELATRMERLTYFLLTYLYTLPAQVAAARELREQEQAE